MIIAALLILVSYALLGEPSGLCSPLCSPPSKEEEQSSGQSEGNNDEREPPSLDSESTVLIAETTLATPAPELELVAQMQKLSIAVVEPDEPMVEQLHVDAFSPVPASPSYPYPVPLILATVEQEIVEAFAPTPDSRSDHLVFSAADEQEIVEAFAPTPRSLVGANLGLLSPLDSFWDGRNSFVCSTPICDQANLSDTESLNFEQHFIEEFKDTPVDTASSSVAGALSQYVAAKENLDTLIEMHIESIESMCSVSNSLPSCSILIDRVLLLCRDLLMNRCGRPSRAAA